MEARKTAVRLVCNALNKRVLGLRDRPSLSALSDALNAGYPFSKSRAWPEAPIRPLRRTTSCDRGDAVALFGHSRGGFPAERRDLQFALRVGLCGAAICPELAVD